MSLRLIGAGVSFLIVFASGVWLTRAGRPYGGALLNAHKLVSLAGVVLLALFVRQQARAETLSPAQAATVAITGALFLAAIITGGLASIDRPVSRAVVIAHRTLPFISLVASAASIYLLLGLR